MSTVEKKFTDLVAWEGNPRPASNYEKRTEMRASLAHTGQIMPLIGRPQGNKIEIIAGRNRMLSIGELIEENKWDADKTILVHVRDMDDAEALEIATSENINIPMHPMHQFEAFSRMVEMGKDPITIANTYGVSERIVARRLSYAKLDERARDLVKNDERDLEWASAMTLASPTEQAAVLDEIEMDSRRLRSAAEIRMRLQDDLVPLSYALFDVTDADDKLVRKDLFDPNEEMYMHRKDFTPLQNTALENQVQEAKDAGWSDVLVVPEKEFDIYKYESGVTDKSKGIVVFVRYMSGEIVKHEGYALRFEERLNQIDTEDEEAAASIFGDEDGEDTDVVNSSIFGDEEESEIYTETSKTTKHLAKERAGIIQKMMLEDPKAALAVTVAGLIAKSGAKPIEGKVFEDLSALDNESKARQTIEEKRNVAHDILSNANIDPMDDYKEILKGLYNLSQNDLMIIYQSEMAMRIPTDLKRISDLQDALLEATQTTIGDHWVMDRAFLSTLSIKALNALAKDILPPRLLSKLGRSKSDIVETLAEIAEDVRNDGGRLDATERRAFTAWAPTGLGGEQFNDLEIGVEDGSSIFDDDGASIFGAEEDDDGDAMKMVA